MPRWRRGFLLSPIKDDENLRQDSKIVITDDVDASPMTRIAIALDKSTLTNGDTPKRYRRDSNISNDVIDEISQKLGE